MLGVYGAISTRAMAAGLASFAAADLTLLARLRATGTSIPETVPIVEEPSRGHGDYLDATRPECGYSIVLAELAAAFAE